MIPNIRLDLQRHLTFPFPVNLVERETSPNGVALVDPNRSGKRGAYDLVELAANIEKADQFTKANAGSKLTVIAEQGRSQD